MSNHLLLAKTGLATSILVASFAPAANAATDPKAVEQQGQIRPVPVDRQTILRQLEAARLRVLERSERRDQEWEAEQAPARAEEKESARAQQGALLNAEREARQTAFVAESMRLQAEADEAARERMIALGRQIRTELDARGDANVKRVNTAVTNGVIAIDRAGDAKSRQLAAETEQHRNNLARDRDEALQRIHEAEASAIAAAERAALLRADAKRKRH